MLPNNRSSATAAMIAVQSVMDRQANCGLEMMSSYLNTTNAAVAAVPLAIWAGLVAAGTVMPKSPVGILSLRSSLKELTIARASRLNVLDVFRVIAILWVMMNHTGSEGRIDILERKPSADAFKKAVHEHPVFGALLGNSALGVEVFLVLSGLLAARSWLRQADMPFKDHYASYVSRRVLRLFPSIGLFVYIAAGPLMRIALPRFHNTMISACGASGVAAHLTFLSNWQETPTCLGYLWYIGLDMQLHLIAPFFLHALVKRGRFAVALIVLTVAISSVLRAGYCVFYNTCNKSDVDIPFISYPDVDPETVKGVYLGLWEMYARPYTKCGPFLIGMLFGWASSGWEKQGIRFNKRVSFALISFGLAVGIATIYAILPEYWWPDMTANVYNITYTAIFRNVFAIALIAMVAGLTLQHNVITVCLGWSVLARLTFSAYLLHMPVVYIFNHLQYLQEADSAIALLVVLPLVALVSFGVALPFYLFVESPIGRIITSWERAQKVDDAMPRKIPLLSASSHTSSLEAPLVTPDCNQNVSLLDNIIKHHAETVR